MQLKKTAPDNYPNRKRHRIYTKLCMRAPRQLPAQSTAARPQNPREPARRKAPPRPRNCSTTF